MFRVSRTPAGVKTAAAKFVGQLYVRAYSGFFTIGKTELTVGNFDRGETGKFRNFPNRRSFGIFDEKKSVREFLKFRVDGRCILYFFRGHFPTLPCLSIFSRCGNVGTAKRWRSPVKPKLYRSAYLTDRLAESPKCRSRCLVLFLGPNPKM